MPLIFPFFFFFLFLVRLYFPLLFRQRNRFSFIFDACWLCTETLQLLTRYITVSHCRTIGNENGNRMWTEWNDFPQKYILRYSNVRNFPRGRNKINQIQCATLNTFSNRNYYTISPLHVPGMYWTWNFSYIFENEKIFLENSSNIFLLCFNGFIAIAMALNVHCGNDWDENHQSNGQLASNLIRKSFFVISLLDLCFVDVIYWLWTMLKVNWRWIVCWLLLLL